MHFRLHPILEPDWPALAWIARCERSNPVITVRHGPQVETREDWLCEAVWDGEFEAGDFDRTDLVFGSGIRLRDEGIIFVRSPGLPVLSPVEPADQSRGAPLSMGGRGTGGEVRARRRGHPLRQVGKRRTRPELSIPD